MPELPEVETTVRQMRPLCVGQRITDVTVNWARHVATPSPKQFRQRLRGQKIECITRRAKYLVFHLTSENQESVIPSPAGARNLLDHRRDSSSRKLVLSKVEGTLLGMTERLYLLIHLKMSGRLGVFESGTPRDKHDHTIFHFADGHELRFNDTRKFGKVYLVDDVEEVTGGLGPEPLEDSFTVKQFAAILEAHHKPMKSFLLDQTFIAGIGNIYADESLHRAKIHPKRYSDSLKPDEIKKLWRSIRYTLAVAIKHNGSSIDWVYGGGDHQNYFRVYGRENESCHTCGKPIQRIMMGGRSTHYCSRCQRI